MPRYYSLKPIVCGSCGAKLETSLIFRLWLPIVVLVLFVNWAAIRLGGPHSNRTVALPIFLTAVALILLSIITGAVVEAVRPWSLVKWDDNAHWRKMINMGALGVPVLLILAFLFLQKG